MNIHLNFWSKFVVTSLIVFSVGMLLVFAVILSPAAVSSTGSPAPAASTTPSFSPESLCGQAFPSRLDPKAAPEKRTFEEAEYQKCVQARKAALAAPQQTPNFSARPKPQATFSGGSTALVPRTPAGAGTILEESASPLGSFYEIQNS